MLLPCEETWSSLCKNEIPHEDKNPTLIHFFKEAALTMGSVAQDILGGESTQGRRGGSQVWEAITAWCRSGPMKEKGKEVCWMHYMWFQESSSYADKDSWGQSSLSFRNRPAFLCLPRLVISPWEAWLCVNKAVDTEPAVGAVGQLLFPKKEVWVTYFRGHLSSSQLDITHFPPPEKDWFIPHNFGWNNPVEGFKCPRLVWNHYLV